MSTGATHESAKIIEGQPVDGSLVERVAFCPESPVFKVRVIQIKYMYPRGFTYRQLMSRFDVSKRTAYRWVARMKEMGICRLTEPDDAYTTRAKYVITNP